MARTYVAGVFLTICTYEGPQLVYHYYDDRVGSEGDESVSSSDDGLDWSSEESSEGELSDSDSFYLKSPSSKSTSSRHLSGITPPASKSRYQYPKPHASVTTHSSSASEPINGSARNSKASNNFTSDSMSTSTSVDPSRSVSGSENLGPNSATNNSRATPRSLGMLSRLSETTAGADRSSESNLSPGTPTSPDFSRPRPVELPCGLDKDILAEILTPPETMCNEKFTLTVDDCMLVGIPVHILDTGTWRPLRPGFTDQHEEPVKGDPAAQTQTSPDAIESEDGRPAINVNSPEASPVRKNASTGTDTDADTDADTLKDADDGANTGTDSKDTGEDSAEPSVSRSVPRSPRVEPSTVANVDQLKGVITDKDSPMRMFHVSFALIPPITEAAICEERVYKFILVPFVRMLRQEQASKNYVWEEVSKMQRVHESLNKASAAEIQEAMESVSELARALRRMCTAIANMDIARIIIGSKARAFQVPLQLELAQLPSWYDEISPHSYVSTINSPSKEIGHECYECYGLLLLDDPEVILQEIEVDPQGPVAAMIRNIEPTSSLEELALQNNIEIKQIVNLVWSLVYWRRARIIIPIHARYTYFTSPLSPITTNFPELAAQYHNIFPMMPPMQKLLALLSTGKPKPFAMHIPSTDHRHIYLQALSWLMQKDFVTHLPTFALVVVTRKIKLSSMNTEQEQAIESNEGDTTNNNNNSKQQQAEAPQNGDQSSASRARHINVDLKLTPERASSSQNFSDTTSDAIKRKRLLRRRLSNRTEIEEIQDSIIQDPRKATPLEKRWLGQISVSGSSRNTNLAAMFQRLTKYFNGKDCLEQVMIHERISREDMRSFMQEFSQYIVTYKHW